MQRRKDQIQPVRAVSSNNEEALEWHFGWKSNQNWFLQMGTWSSTIIVPTQELFWWGIKKVFFCVRQNSFYWQDKNLLMLSLWWMAFYWTLQKYISHSKLKSYETVYQHILQAEIYDEGSSPGDQESVRAGTPWSRWWSWILLL